MKKYIWITLTVLLTLSSISLLSAQVGNNNNNKKQLPSELTLESTQIEPATLPSSPTSNRSRTGVMTKEIPTDTEPGTVPLAEGTMLLSALAIGYGIRKRNRKE